MVYLNQSFKNKSLFYHLNIFIVFTLIYFEISFKINNVQNSVTGEVRSCEIEWSEIDKEPYLSVHKQSLTGSKWTIKRILWNTDYAVGWEIVVFEGYPNIEWDWGGIQLQVTSSFGTMNQTVPRDIYQEPCNRLLFDTHCGLTQSDYAYSGTATGGSRTTLEDTTAGIVYKVNFDGGDSSNLISRGDEITGQTGSGTAKVVQIVYLTSTSGTLWYVEQSGVQYIDDEEIQDGDTNSIIVSGTPAEDTTFYELGEIEMLTGNNAGQIRPLYSSITNTRTVFWPFVNDVESGDTYKIYPGCNKDVVASCYAKFNNNLNWRGFAYTPKSEDGVFGKTPEYILA